MGMAAAIAWAAAAGAIITAGAGAADTITAGAIVAVNRRIPPDTALIDPLPR